MEETLTPNTFLEKVAGTRVDGVLVRRGNVRIDYPPQRIAFRTG